jgi:predicted esterase
MTRVDRLAEIGAPVAYLDLLVARLREEGGGEPAVRALGFSQGVATLARWLVFGATRVERAVAWGGLLPEDLDLAQLADCLGGAPLAFVIGDDDGHRSAEQVQAQAAAARERGVVARVVTYAGGHALDAPTLAAVAAS